MRLTFGGVTGPSIRLVVPYFGERPPYLALVVRSMAANPDVYWLLITDAPVPDAPPNVTRAAVRVRRPRRPHPAATSTSRSAWSARTSCATSGPPSARCSPTELTGYDFWGHCDLDLVFGRIRDHLPAEAFEADKVLIQGNFALYRNTAEAAGWFRHEVGRVSYRTAMTTPAAQHFDEMAGMHYVLARPRRRVLAASDVIFDLSFHRYRTRAEQPPGRDPRRYAWEQGEVCEYRLERAEIVRRTALLVHLQKRTMRPPSDDVLARRPVLDHGQRLRRPGPACPGGRCGRPGSRSARARAVLRAPGPAGRAPPGRPQRRRAP